MARPTPLGRRIVKAIDRARRLDPSLTIKDATKRIHISRSSYYKLRAGKTSGAGRISKAIQKRPVGAHDRPQGIRNMFTVTFRNASGSRVGSRNMVVDGMKDQVDSLVIQSDKRQMTRVIKRQLDREAKDAERRNTGSAPWSKKDRAGLYVESIHPTITGHADIFVLHSSDYTG